MVPEVYRIYNGSLPFTGTISAGLTSLMASFQETSKSAFNFTLNCSRWKIIHFLTLWFDNFIASSKRGLYSTILPGSIPQEAEIISFGEQSSILTASSLAANPPKTTECTAPILAIAKTAIIASGIIGI